MIRLELIITLLYSATVTVHWASHVLQGTRNTRPCITGHPVIQYTYRDKVGGKDDIPASSLVDGMVPTGDGGHV